MKQHEVEKMSQSNHSDNATYVLTLEEISNLAAEGGKAENTLLNVVALIAKRFRTDVCSAYLLEPDRSNLVLAATA
jgi:signal transduction protein with GAF and PtsI domain